MRALTKEEFKFMVNRDLSKRKARRKLVKSEVERYIFTKKYECSKKDALHKRRQPHWKSK